MRRESRQCGEMLDCGVGRLRFALGLRDARKNSGLDFPFETRPRSLKLGRDAAADDVVARRSADT
eukprot:7984008-Pyramimonas_sp.AAC.1